MHGKQDFHAGCLFYLPNTDFAIAINKQVRNCINTADYSTIDGKPILGLAKKEHKKNFQYKISGSDMILDLLPIINEKHWSIIIFGGKEGVAEKAKELTIKNSSKN